MKSLQKNALFVSIRTTLSLILPLITFPYLTRTLQVETLGRYNFSLSIVNYFVILAELGISTYAIREGSKIREDSDLFNQFVNEIISINIFSAIFSYILLFILTNTVSKFNSYITLILLLSLQIAFNTFSKVWIYNIFEEFGLITIIQILVQIVSLILLFMFVKTPNDLTVYALIQIITTGLANIFYGVYAKKYYKSKLHFNLGIIKKHIKPIMLIFSSTVATIIYVNSDVTILGLLVNDKCVGLYTTASKIYTIVKQVLLAVISVTIPRLAFYTNDEKFKFLFKDIFNALVAIILPASIGLYCISENIILIIAGVGYTEAITALQILSITLIFALLACLYGTAVLIPYGYEKKFFYATLLSALTNIVLNYILIPSFQQDAAAFTTLVAEIIVCIICYIYAKKYIFKTDYLHIGKIVIGCGLIYICCKIVQLLNFSIIIETAFCIFFSAVLYFGSQLILKNVFLLEFIKKLAKR